MRLRGFLLLLLLSPASLPAQDGAAAELARQVRWAGLDRDECYQVRDLSFSKEDIRFYFTEGYLIFGKPVDGHRHSAVFLADVEGGDGELILFPPSRAERLSLARATDSPNLNEHFKLAVMIFTDDTYEALSKQIRDAPDPLQSPERGVLMEEAWTDAVRNLSASFQTRLIHDSLSGAGPSKGFFYAGVNGDKLGNFDILYDPLAEQQIAVGRVVLQDSLTTFDTWTSFPSRSFRNKARTLPDDTYRLSNYRLEASLQPDLSLNVTTRVTVTPTQAGVKVLAFSLSPRMRLSSTSINGVPAEFLQREALRESLIRGLGSAILVVASSPLASGKAYEFEFKSEGKVIQEAGNNVYFVGSRENWYPRLASQFARYDVKFRYPKALSLVVAGEVVEQGTDAEWNFTHTRMVNPVCVLGFNLGDYTHLRVSRGPYDIEVYANKQFEPAVQPKPRPAIMLPPRPVYNPATRTNIYLPNIVDAQAPGPLLNPAARLQEMASEVAGAFEFMAARFGPPPVSNLTVSPIPGRFGQGFPGLVYLSTLAYLPPEERQISSTNQFQQTFFSEILHAHEVAHQWWGNVVTPASSQDTWLMEALANYSALLYLEKRKGPKALEPVLAEYSKRLRATAAEGRTVESMGPIAWGLRLVSSQAPDAWQTITYEKGSWIMHMLRRRLGDDRFMAMLGELAKRYRQSTLNTEQFRALAAEFSPQGSPDQNLVTFFDNWVYSTGIPSLKLSYSVKGKAPAFSVSGTVTQSDVDEEFTAWVPIEIQFKTGKPFTQWVRSSSDPAPFAVSFKQSPLKVLLDPAGSLLAVRK